MKKIILTVCVVLCILLCSCKSPVYDGICGILGIDNTNYAVETVVSVIEPDDTEAVKLADVSKILCYGDSVIEFDSFADCSKEYIDVILNYLSGTFYNRYCSNEKILNEFSASYPYMYANEIIPLSDYENTVYSYFGGNRRAVVSSTSTYSYLDKIDAFILVGENTGKDVEYEIKSLIETENTYRLELSFYKNKEYNGTYDIIFKKRDGGEPYIWRVSEAEGYNKTAEAL